MKCSECNKDILPVVAIDIDGTLGNYHSHFLEFAEAYTGRKLETNDTWYHPWHYKYDGSIGFKEWFIENFETTEEEWKDIKLAYRQGAQKRSMPVYPGADQFIAQVKFGIKVELWLTTTRPYQRMDNIDPDTRAWLERNNIRYDGLLYDELKFQSLVKIVDPARVVAVVDDLPEMLEEGARLFGTVGDLPVPIMRCSGYNKGAVVGPGISEGKGWEDIRMQIRDRAMKWKELQGVDQQDAAVPHSGAGHSLSRDGGRD